MRLPNIVTITHTLPSGEMLSHVTHNVRTNAGAFLVAQAQGSGSQSPSIWVACSPLTIVASMSDVGLPGELTTGGLARQQATFANYNPPITLDGPATYQLTTTFVALAPQVVNSLGCFNAQTGGTLSFETNIAPQNLVTQSTLQVAWTFNV